jgi:hypothetical protein
MAFDFSHLTPKKTAWITLTDVRVRGDRDVELEIQCAASDDSPYTKAMRKAAEEIRRAGAADSRAIHIGIIAKTIIVGWRNVYAPGDVPLPYRASGEDSGEEMLKAFSAASLGEFYLDRITGAAHDPSRFRDPLPSPVDLGNG